MKWTLVPAKYMREIATLPPWGNDIFFLSDCLILQKQDCTDRYTLFRQKKDNQDILQIKRLNFISTFEVQNVAKLCWKLKFFFALLISKLQYQKVFVGFKIHTYSFIFSLGEKWSKFDETPNMTRVQNFEIIFKVSRVRYNISKRL